MDVLSAITLSLERVSILPAPPERWQLDRLSLKLEHAVLRALWYARLRQVLASAGLSAASVLLR